MKMKVLTIGIILFFFSLSSFGQIAPDSSKTDSFVVEEATFPGGTQKWTEYIVANISDSLPLKNGAPKSTYKVIIVFTINRFGKIIDAYAKTNFGFGIEAEVRRVILNSPKWNPQKINGKPLMIQLQQPVLFSIPK